MSTSFAVDGLRPLQRIHNALYGEVGALTGREASPTAAIINSQSAKGVEKGGVARSLGF